MSSETESVNPYAAAVTAKYKKLKTLYATNNKNPNRVSFWKLGNTFDTLIDYLDIVDRSSADDVAAMVVTQCAESIKDIPGGYDGAWFDDFGWWSVACERAMQKSFFKPSDTAAFQKILDNCWHRFANNAPYVWERRTATQFNAYGPAVPGGVWNAYWTGTANQYPGPKNGDPSNGGLIGIQNTVTNALFLMAAHRLGHNDKEAHELAEREFTFLIAWFDQASYPLWWKLNDKSGLVRERVGHFDKGKEAKGFQEDWAWAGDQGLMLGNLSDAMTHIEPGRRGPMMERIIKLVAGVNTDMTNSGHVLQSFTRSGNPPDGDTKDYQTGSGVFWRNALHAWKTNSELSPVFASASFKTTLRNSAAAANNTNTDLSFDDLANDVAVLVAATAMLA